MDSGQRFPSFPQPVGSGIDEDLLDLRFDESHPDNHCNGRDSPYHGGTSEIRKESIMGLRFLEHMLILTHDPEATRDWFCKSLGFRSGYHPEFGFPVYWLYIGDQDVVHIGKAHHSEHQDTYLRSPGDKEGDDYSAAGALGSGRIDHVCFNCDGIEEFIERLTRAGVDFNERKAHNSN